MLRPGPADLPRGWTLVQLGELATIATGTTPPTADAGNYGDTLLFVSPADLGEAKYITDTAKKLSRTGARAARRFPGGSILFVCIGSTIGKCAVAPFELTANQQINAIFPAPAFSTDFLYYAMSLAAPGIRLLAGAQAVPIINKRQFARTELALPPLPEQRRIAAALADVDALITALGGLIAKERDLKRATMQQLLTGQVRLPGFTGPWRTVHLGEIAHIATGSRNAEDRVADGQYPFFVRSATVETIDRPAYDCEAILVPGEGGIGSIFHYVHGRFDAHQRVYVVSRFAPGALGKFVFFVMTMNFGAHAMHHTVKATVDSLRRPTLQTFRFRLPPEPEQRALAGVLSDMDAALQALEQRREQARAIKQGMMQALLTGRTRLP